MIKVTSAETILAALKHNPRQYLVGDLKLPQELAYFHDENVELGLTQYTEYKWEKPHYHTTCTEYQYMIKGESKYLNLKTLEETYVKEGDAFFIEPDTPYLSKALPGALVLFFKYPGGNDKVLVEMTEAYEKWCASWDSTL